MIPDYHPYVVEHKLGNDFLRDSNYSQKRERQIIENRHFILLENDMADFIKLKKIYTKDIIYKFNDSFSLKIPFELKYLEKAYQKSEYIINLEDDWDDEGSTKYDFEIWKKALIFVNHYSTSLLLDFNKKIEMPKIYHGPNGSIDILLENENYSLLINYIGKIDKAYYYGNDNFGNITKGEINATKFNSALIPIAFNF